MTGNKIVLDTNIVAAWLKGEEGIADKIDKAKEVYLPIIVIGELYYGAHYSTKVQKNISDIVRLTSQYNTLSIDESTTILYGQIKTKLRKKGKPVPENDIWIAAIAMQYNLIIITRDKHFKEIEGIKIRAWQ
jgi:tRNA(fMet)-specific endonuclease VapC